MEYLESKDQSPLSEEEALEWEAEMEAVEQEIEMKTEVEEKVCEEETTTILIDEMSNVVSEDVEMTLVGDLQTIDAEGGIVIAEYDINGCETNTGYIIVSDSTGNIITDPSNITTSGNENVEPNNQILPKESVPPPPPSKNCRLCLTQSKYLPEENGMHFMKTYVKKIMVMKKFAATLSASVPDRFCDDCMGKLLVASDIADKCKISYEYFHPKLAQGMTLTLSPTLCCVCLTEFNDENEITIMSTATESYFHLIASRNSKYKGELNIKKQSCLKCVHDLELTNTLRYKNWKTEKVLQIQFGDLKNKMENEPPKWVWNESSDSEDEENHDFTTRYLNPALTQIVDCQYCLKQFPNETKLRLHLQEAHVPISSECLQCGLKLVNERGAKLHYLSVHMRFVEAICDICGKTYHSMNKLNKHRIIHFEERNIACEMCPAKFKRKDNLKIHMRVHSGLKPFKCKYCSKCYAHHTDLKRHTFTHTGQYPFVCKYCKAGFCKKIELKEHEDQHNPFDPNRKMKEEEEEIVKSENE